MKARSNILRSDVAKWWYENKENELYNDYGYLIDIGEPTCWACNMYYNTTKVYSYKRHGDNVFGAWDDASFLQICHIVPRSLGGTDDFDNLFLLCSDCHDKLPDTVFPEIFAKSVKMTTPKVGKYDMEELLRILVKYDVNDEKRIELLEVLNSIEFKKWSNDKIGLHKFQGNRRGAGIKKETVVASALYFIENVKNK